MFHHHSHEGHNERSTLAGNLNRAFIIGIVLNIGFVILEVAAGFATNSLGLLTDAGHNLSDVAGLALSLLAFRMAKIKPDDRFTYGYSKTTILVALVNAVILLVAVGSIGVEAFKRFAHPEPLQGNIISVVAGIGIFVNVVSALLFLRYKERDLNLKGAYLHLMADALVSAAVVVAGLLIMYTGWFWIDSVVSIVVMVVILYSTWRLLTDSLRLSLDAVPRNVNLGNVKEEILKFDGVRDIHHIHVWALSTTVNAMTAHIIINETLSAVGEQHLKECIKNELLHMNIQHVTLETERGAGKCAFDGC